MDERERKRISTWAVCPIQFLTMSDGLGRVLLFHGTGAGSSVIEFLTHSKFSHAALLYPDGETIIEALQFYGVRKRKMTTSDWQRCSVFWVRGMTDFQWRNCIADAEQELGKPYDWLSLICWLLRIRSRVARATHWFCSEYAYEKIENQGLYLLRKDSKDANQITPYDLGITPMLAEDISAR